MALPDFLLFTLQVFMNPASIPQKVSDALVSRNVDEEVLIVDQERDKIHQLNLSAAFIWNQCDGHNSVAEIVTRTSENFDIDVKQVTKDVDDTLGNLIELDLIKFLEH